MVNWVLAYIHNSTFSISLDGKDARFLQQIKGSEARMPCVFITKGKRKGKKKRKQEGGGPKSRRKREGRRSPVRFFSIGFFMQEGRELCSQLR